MHLDFTSEFINHSSGCHGEYLYMAMILVGSDLVKENLRKTIYLNPD